MALQYLAQAFGAVLTPMNMGVLLLSTFAGLIMGMLPGLSATMAVALLTGLTYRLSSTSAIISLIGVYVGAISGGCRHACKRRNGAGWIPAGQQGQRRPGDFPGNHCFLHRYTDQCYLCPDPDTASDQGVPAVWKLGILPAEPVRSHHLHVRVFSGSVFQS